MLAMYLYLVKLSSFPVYSIFLLIFILILILTIVMLFSIAWQIFSSISRLVIYMYFKSVYLKDGTLLAIML